VHENDEVLAGWTFQVPLACLRGYIGQLSRGQLVTH